MKLLRDDLLEHAECVHKKKMKQLQVPVFGSQWKMFECSEHLFVTVEKNSEMSLVFNYY